MLLRLRWDDSDATARARLSEIVGRIWDGLEGVDLTGAKVEVQAERGADGAPQARDVKAKRDAKMDHQRQEGDTHKAKKATQSF